MLAAVCLLAMVVGACAKKVAPVAVPAAPAPTPTVPAVTPPPPAPPQPVSEPLPVPPEPVPEDTVGSRSLDDLNRDSPLRPVFFELDRAELAPAGQAVLQANAATLKKYATWQITIEGHCDERGSAEYNLALGERRAAAVRDYLISLGIASSRVRIVSYGKEFPFEPGHDESAWSKNRRAHFVITAK